MPRPALWPLVPGMGSGDERPWALLTSGVEPQSCSWGMGAAGEASRALLVELSSLNQGFSAGSCAPRDLGLCLLSQPRGQCSGPVGGRGQRCCSAPAVHGAALQLGPSQCPASVG